MKRGRQITGGPAIGLILDAIGGYSLERPSPGVKMTEHYNRPPLDLGHVYIQPMAAIPGHHTITRSGGSSLIANSTSPHADAGASLRAAGVNAPTHVIIWATAATRSSAES